MQDLKYFIPNDTFDNSIRNKEKGVLRALLIGIIGSDPTFATKEYDEANAYVKSQSERINGSALNLFEAYQEQEGEYKKTQEEGWNEEYYQMLLVWYRDNYANERLQSIKEVGKEVYKNKPTLGKSKQQNRVTQQIVPKQNAGRNTQSQKKVPVVRLTGNDMGKEWLTIIEWFKQNWWWIAVIGAGSVAIFWLLFRK